ncbi:hypothetical protein D9M73_44630 [compost metagenome]
MKLILAVRVVIIPVKLNFIHRDGASCPSTERCLPWKTKRHTSLTSPTVTTTSRTQGHPSLIEPGCRSRSRTPCAAWR